MTLREIPIPGFGFAQSQNFGIEERFGIRDPGIAIPSCDAIDGGGGWW